MRNYVLLCLLVALTGACSGSKDVVVDALGEIPLPENENHSDLSAQPPSENVPDLEADQTYFGLLKVEKDQVQSFSIPAVAGVAVVDIEYQAQTDGNLSFSNFSRSWQGDCPDLENEVLFFTLDANGEILNVEGFGMFDSKTVTENSRYLLRSYYGNMGTCLVTQTFSIDLE